MNKTIIKAPCVEMKNLNELFIELTAQNCNLNCKYCYIDFKEKKVKDFIQIEKIKTALQNINRKELNYIHLTGAEPMLHPDFNQILRLCLKYTSVVIHTNALTINDKKARFLKKVEEENNNENEIVFMISLDNVNEKENDDKRGRGSFRKAFHAIQSLIKYDFNPIISIVNYKKEKEETIKENFTQLFKTINFNISDINLKILPLLSKEETIEIDKTRDFDKVKVECARSRTLTLNGVFYCPLLSKDNRGKCGSDFNEYSTKCYIETGFCSQCVAHNKYLFSFEL